MEVTCSNRNVVANREALSNSETPNQGRANEELALQPLSVIARQFPERERASLALLNKAVYAVVHGRPFVHLKGAQDRYVLFPAFSRRQVDEIFVETGRRINWRTGADHLKQLISFEDLEDEQRCSSLLSLGSGSSGIFCIGFALNRGQYVGIKVTEGAASVEAEFHVQQALDDLPHVMHAVDLCKVTTAMGRTTLYQVMDLAGLGNVEALCPVIHNLTDEAFKLQIQFHLAKSLLMGISNMHVLGYYHLDIKLDNFVVEGTGQMSLIDFNCSEQGTDGMIDGLHARGDYNNFSPERWLASYAFGDLCDGGKIDAWAAGLGLLYLFTGRRPPFDRSEIERILRMPSPGRLTHKEALIGYFEGKLRTIPALHTQDVESYWPLIRGLLTCDPEKRLSVSDALQQPWFAYTMHRVQDQREQTFSRLRELIQSQAIEHRPISKRKDYEKAATPEQQAAREVGPTQTRKREQTEFCGPLELPLPHFTDHVARTGLEDTLVNRLLHFPPLTVLQGPPGTGKTELANCLVHHPDIKESYGIRLWFRGADRVSQLELQYAILGQELGIVHEKQSFDETFALVQRYLDDYQKAHNKPWLIVLDNANDRSIIERYVPRGGVVVVTSKSPHWTDSEKIAALSPDESSTLIAQLMGREEPGTDRLGEILGYLPLGLVQACAYMRNQSLSIASYLETFDRTPSRILEANQSIFGKDLPYSIASLWNSIFDAVGQLSPTALRLLQQLSYLSPTNIPMNLIEAIGSKSTDVGALVDYALLKETRPGSYEIHSMLHKAIHARWHDIAMLEKSIEGFERSCQRPKSESGPEQLQARYALIPHGQELIQHCEGRRDRSPTFFDAYANVCSGTGVILSDCGLHKESLPIHRKALELLEGAPTPDRDRVSQCKRNLSSSLSDMGEYLEAMQRCNEALGICIELYGQYNHRVAELMNNLGLILAKLGYTEKLEGIHNCALAIFTEHYGAESLEATRTLNIIANNQHDAGEYEAALAKHRQALGPLGASLGEKNGEYADCVNNIGNDLFALRRLEEALDVHKQALAIRKELYGESHPRLAISYNNLGNVLFVLEELEQARDSYEKALGLRRTLYGNEHPEVAESLGSLGIVLHKTGDVAGAEALCREALEIQRKTVGEVSHAIAATHGNLGIILASAERTEEAIGSYQAQLSILSKLYGGVHPRIASTLKSLGDALAKCGQRDEAARHYMSAIQMRTRFFGEKDPGVMELCHCILRLKSEYQE